VGTMCSCDATWTGKNICHCSVCHRTFSGVTLFDKHRKVEPGECTLAGEMEFRNGMWRWPEMTEEEKTRRGF